MLRKTDARRSKWFASYLASILQKDIQELSRIEGLSGIPKILHLLSTRVGRYLRNRNKIYVTLRQHDFKVLKRLEEIAGNKLKKSVLLHTGDQ